MMQAMEGAIDSTSDGSRNSRRRFGSESRRSKHRCNWEEAHNDDDNDDDDDDDDDMMLI